jgi:hypothetical protein
MKVTKKRLYPGSPLKGEREGREGLGVEGGKGKEIEGEREGRRGMGMRGGEGERHV